MSSDTADLSALLSHSRGSLRGNRCIGTGFIYRDSFNVGNVTIISSVNIAEFIIHLADWCGPVSPSKCEHRTSTVAMRMHSIIQSYLTTIAHTDRYEHTYCDKMSVLVNALQKISIIIQLRICLLNQNCPNHECSLLTHTNNLF